MDFASNNPTPAPHAGPLMVLVAVLAIGGAWVLTEQYLTASMAEGFAPEAQDVQIAAAEGSSVRRLGFALLAGLGFVCLLRTLRRPFALRGVLPALLLFYVVWCVMSTAWSTDVGLTVRRLGVLVCCFVGALGVGRQFTLRQLCVISLAVTGAYVFIGLGVEFYLSTFHPWYGTYRFAGTVHPNLQASYCATASLAALCLLTRGAAPRGLLIALLTAAVAFLLLTKSRTTAISFLVAAAALGTLRSNASQRGVTVIFVGCLASTLVLALLLGGVDVQGSAVDTLLMGRSEGAVSLSGRIPLWHELIHTVGDRLLIGYGYGAFWDPEHVQLASYAVGGSGISHAHSAYVETVVNVGLIGLLALVFTAIVGLRRTHRACREAADPGCDFLFALLVYGVAQSVLESTFANPVSIPFLAACGLVHLGFCPADESQPVPAGDTAPLGDLARPDDTFPRFRSLPR